MANTAPWTYWFYPIAACLFAVLVFWLVDRSLIIKTSATQPSESTMWELVTSWTVVGIIGPALVCLGFGVLGMTPAAIRLSLSFFSVGYLLILCRAAIG